jgi:hypothetical protein
MTLYEFLKQWSPEIPADKREQFNADASRLVEETWDRSQKSREE